MSRNYVIVAAKVKEYVVEGFLVTLVTDATHREVSQTGQSCEAKADVSEQDLQWKVRKTKMHGSYSEHGKW